MSASNFYAEVINHFFVKHRYAGTPSLHLHVQCVNFRPHFSLYRKNSAKLSSRALSAPLKENKTDIATPAASI